MTDNNNATHPYTSKFVKTKLYVPRLPESFIPRQRLIDKINLGVKHHLLIITAPAGYGKSTLLVDWAAQSKIPVCWLSLDQSENDPQIMFSNYISSIQTQFQNFGVSIQAALNSHSSPNLYSLISAMINEIDEINRNFAIIMDDFHHIENSLVIDTIGYLADHQPSNLYLLIAGRKETLISSARRRLHGEVIQLGIDDLRFDFIETLSFLRSRLGMRISDREISILGNRTEGWIAGLQMAAISMQSEVDLPAFVADFSGANRMVTDYLVDEVLSHQEVELQNFMLKTCILDKLEASLCNHISDTQYSQTMLETLEQRGLFLIPLDNTRTWFRYHHLFAKLLQNHLQALYPDQITVLHKKASDWYLAHEMLEDSIDHIFETKDHHLIVQRIELVSGSVLANGKFKVFIEWLGRIPKWYVERNQYLLLVQAFMLFELSDLEGCQRNLEFIGNTWGESAPQGVSEKENSSNAMYGVLEAVRSAYFYGGEGDVDKAYLSAQNALKYLNEGDSFWRILAWLLVGLYHQWRGNYDLSISYFSQATEMTVKEHNLFLGVISISILAKLYLKTGCLSKAIEVCQKAISLYSSKGYKVSYSGQIYLTLAELYFLRTDFGAAEHYILQGIDLVEKHQDVHSIIHGNLNLARIYLSTNKKEKAQHIMSNLVSKIRDYSPSINALTRAFASQAYIWIYSGNLKFANRWIESLDHASFDVEHPFDVSSSYAYRGAYLAPQDLVFEVIEFVRFTEARLSFSSGDQETAIRISEDILSQSRNQSRIYSRIQFLILKSLVLSKLDRLEEAANTLLEAIGFAAPETLCQPFIQEGERLSSILDKIETVLQEREPLSIKDIYNLQFTKRLQICIEKNRRGKSKDYPCSLTPREIQVIQSLAKGNSYSEIAHSMAISENTLRTHIQRIYRKLGVTNRLQAVNRAESLGLLNRSQS